SLLSALKSARDAGSRLAFDPNYRPRLWTSTADARAAIDPAISLADILMPTFPDEQMLYGDTEPQATVDRLRRHGAREIVVKSGVQHALVADGYRIDSIDAVMVARPVDTTGAGDSFNGGY